jgi:BirA family biotin operon repressor/biotin-[acetyl-CoA-carboxylase] ligase
MKSPVGPGEEWVTVDEVESTQNLAAQFLKDGQPVAVVFAKEQTAGKGRLGRTWLSRSGDSLTFSLIFREYAGHAQPHLIGMACALAAAGVLRCQLRWPNDLVFGEMKVGGILTELLPDSNGRLVPIVGIGVNLNQAEFPKPIAEIATSLALARGGTYDPLLTASKIVERLASLPEPENWAALAPVWSLYDFTPGKRYKLGGGEEAIALGIGSEGQLMCSVDGESRSILAAEALFGT